MAGISVSGIGSGLDIEAIVTGIMNAERIPVDNLAAEKKQYEAEITSFGKLTSSLDTLRAASRELGALGAFRMYSATSSDEDVVSVTAGSGASAGDYAIEVVNLAERHKLETAAINKDTKLGDAGDTMSMTVDGTTFTVEVGDKTLAEIRDAINSANDNSGVQASIINGDNDEQKLILTAKQSGTDNAISFSYADSGGTPINDTDIFTGGITQMSAAEDAQIKVDGVTVTRASNTIGDAVDGLTITLKAESTPGVAEDIAITTDQSAVATAVQSFVTSYNGVLNTISDLRFKEGMYGDRTLNSAESQLRSILNSPATGLSYDYLSEIGVSVDIKDVEVTEGVVAKQSYLKVDTTKLNEALSNNYDGVKSLFTDSSSGYATRLTTKLNDLLGLNGLMANRKSGLESEIGRIDDRTAILERRLDQQEERLRKQYATLDTLVFRFKSLGESLTQQLANLPFNNQQD